MRVYLISMSDDSFYGLGLNENAKSKIPKQIYLLVILVIMIYIVVFVIFVIVGFLPHPSVLILHPH